MGVCTCVDMGVTKKKRKKKKKEEGDWPQKTHSIMG